ncbi:MAG: methyl-accepting chemotaxis protein [Pseudomonadota bacterium]
MRISQKIAVGYIGLTLLILVSGGVGYYGVKTLSDTLGFVAHQAWDTADGAMEGVIGLQAEMLAIEEAVVAGTDASSRNEYLNRAETAKREGHAALDRMRRAGLIDKRMLAELDSAIAAYDAAKERAITAIRQADAAAIRERMAELRREAETLHDILDRTEEAGDGQVESRTESIAAASQAAVTLMVFAAVAGLLAAIGATLWARHSISKPIERVVERLRDISEGAGDLTVTLPAEGRDEFGELAKLFNRFVAKLRDVMSSVVAPAEQLSHASGRLAQVTETTTRAIERQKMETTHLATAMHEMSATSREVAHHAEHGAEAAAKTKAEAMTGKQVVDEAVASINALAAEIARAAEVIARLEQESQSIGSVLDVIQGIAEQTNLLALNAAIEAARAGEHGRGFAVVADEVRTLASRTHDSTREIHAMIERLQAGTREAVSVMHRSSEQAGRSVAHATRAGDSLHSIAEAIVSISDMTHQVASASEEQTAVANEISRSITAISDDSEATTHGVRETQAASDELVRLSEQLKRLVGQFRV